LGKNVNVANRLQRWLAVCVLAKDPPFERMAIEVSSPIGFRAEKLDVRRRRTGVILGLRIEKSIHIRLSRGKIDHGAAVIVSLIV